MEDALRNRIEGIIQAKKVVLFMKGNKSFPQCGFSGAVVQVLNQVGADYETFNVLSDNSVRDGIKEYASWPTIPQLYVGGQFVGGCDIIREMHAKGELEPMLRAAGGLKTQ